MPNEFEATPLKRICVDTVEPNTPYLDLLSDSGRSDSDDKTSDNTTGTIVINFLNEQTVPAAEAEDEVLAPKSAATAVARPSSTVQFVAVPASDAVDALQS